MIWLRQLGWGAMAAATLAIALASSLISIPEPRDAIAIDRAVFQSSDGQSRDIVLPPSAANRSVIRQSNRPLYRIQFDLAAVPHDALFLLIPATGQNFALEFNGEPIFKSDLRAIWSEPMVRGTSLVRLPRAQLRTGRNEVMLAFGPSRDVLPSYPNKMYVGTEASLAPNFRLRALFEDELKAMALAAQALLTLGILIAYFYRPRDPLFAWLAAGVSIGLIVSTGLFVDVSPALRVIRMVVVALIPAVGLAIIGVALALNGTRPPRALTLATVAVPAVSLLAVVSGLISTPQLVSINVPLLLAGLIVATAIITWGAFWMGGTEARLMLPPIFLLCWFSARDLGILLGLFEGSILMLPYVRALLLASILAVLMRRLAVSLDHLDRANENLNMKLAEQQAELAALHRQERDEAARLVREQERQRLTRDLHDGISGHLVSIIAMAERADGGAKPIEQAAREALDDLRLVIYSLDLGDRELPLALASFRERLTPQLRRLGVELDWSTAELPEVSGVTPGNALSVLRILQEAITNALKHGPARKITIRGAEAPNAMAAISIENDGQPFKATAGGLGVENMRGRARQLGGELQLSTMPRGLKVTLLLPRRLTDLQSTLPR